MTEPTIYRVIYGPTTFDYAVVTPDPRQGPRKVEWAGTLKRARYVPGAANAPVLVATAEEFTSIAAHLGVGHVWTEVQCPAYRTHFHGDCTCGGSNA